MGIIDKALEANRNYANNYDPTPGRRPTPKIAVVACMDPRLSDPFWNPGPEPSQST